MEDIKTKGEKREEKRNKEFNGARQGVRYSNIRVGESLVAFEIARKVKQGKGK